VAICEHCGREFKPKNNSLNYTQRYCGYSCSAKARKKEVQTRKCEYCGKEYTPYRYNGNARYCSKSCSTRASFLNGERKEPTLQSKDRPLTDETVYLVKMWHKQGDSPELIAYILNRNIETIKGILRGEIT